MPRARLPLQTGAGAQRDLVISALAGGPLIAGGVWIAVYSLGMVGGISTESFLIGAVGWALVGAGLSTLLGAYMSGRNHRASDIVIDSDGFSIEGGRKHGVAAAWRELVAEKCTFEDATTSALRFAGTTRYDHALFVSVGGVPTLLAETSEADEQASVEAVLDVIRAKTAPPKPPVARANVLTCGGCGAPAPLADAGSVACPYCRAVIGIPAELRARLQGGAPDPTLAKNVKRVLEQPGALRINGLLVSMAGISYLAVAVGVLSLYFVSLRHLLAPMVAAWASAFFFGRASISGRRALRHVLLGFAARTAPDGSHACARCSGGLPPTEGAVARCIYCGAHNAIGVDFGAQAPRERLELSDILARRASSVTFHTLLGTLMLAAAGVALLVRG